MFRILPRGDLQVHCRNSQWKKTGEDEGQINLKLEFGQEGKGRKGKRWNFVVSGVQKKRRKLRGGHLLVVVWLYSGTSSVPD
jgi:hypothetical protein